MRRLNKVSRSLQFKTAFVVAFAFAAAVSLFYLSQAVAVQVINKVYMSESKVKARNEMYLESFREYAAKGSLSVDDTNAVKRWCRLQKHVYVSVYKNGSLYYETDGTFAETYEPYEYDRQPDYPLVKFSDGEYDVSIIEFSEDRYYNIAFWVSLILAVSVVLVVILTFTGRLIRRIVRLSGEMRKVCDGKLSGKIECDGSDEIASLGRDANDMRDSVIRHYENEQKAWKANNELMTSLSHDIRTPLTTLLLYSDEMASGEVTDMEEIKKYAAICGEKAHQLKDLTDTMFKYFLVFGQGERHVKLEEYNASELVLQLLGEHIFCLMQNGYNINTVDMSEECIIETDPTILKRVFDNVFSNLEKYADKERSISVSLVVEKDDIRVSIINYIPKRASRAESTKIGLKSCTKIMTYVGGKFDYWCKGDLFESLIIIPVKRKSGDKN